MYEIELKFLVDKTALDDIRNECGTGVQRIEQGYIFNAKHGILRVRTIEALDGPDRAFITVKGANKGATRLEFEYEIPIEDAKEMLNAFCKKTLSKNRYRVQYEGHLWEVDEFLGELEGLVLAEVELDHENEQVTIPKWAIEDVTADPKYYNSSLVDKVGIE